MTDQRPETPDKLLNDLQSLQALLDQDTNDPGIPLLRDVVEPADAGPRDALSPTIATSTLELDFDGFEVDEQLFREGLGLEEPTPTTPLPEPAHQPETVTALEPMTAPWPVPAPPTVPPAPVKVAAVSGDPGLVASGPATAHGEDHAAIVPGDDEFAAELVDRCLAELEALLRPQLTQLCRDLLARRTPPGAS